MPLLQSGRSARPVTLHASLAEVTLDVRRDGSGLRLLPRVTVDDETVPLDGALLIGTPVHGIAWWDESPAVSAAARRRLDLAALTASVDDGLRELLQMGSIGVPHRDEERFVRVLLPVLRRRVAVHSSDPSVELPEEAPAVLVLTVHHGDGHRIETGVDEGDRGNRVARAPVAGGGRVPRPEAEATPRWRRSRRWCPGCPGCSSGRLWASAWPRVPIWRGSTPSRFSTDVLPAIAATAGVEVHQVGTVPEYREEVAAPVVSLGGSGSSDNDWFDLTVSVTVGGEKVPFAELFVALAEERVAPDPAVGDLLLARTCRAPGAGPAHRRGPGAARDHRRRHPAQPVPGQPVGGPPAGWGWSPPRPGRGRRRCALLTGASDRTEHAMPDGVQAELRPYQQTGFNWLAYLYEHRLGGILADDMGLGKTLQALALMCHTRERGLTDAPYLVVAPTSVVGNWVAECRRFTPGLAAATVTETGRRRATTLAEMAGSADVVVTSYSLFRLDYEEYAAVAWAGLFLDEAQFAKNRSSQAYQRARMLPVAVQGGDDRNAHREQPDGAVVAAVDHRAGPVPQPRALRRVLPDAHRAPGRRRAAGPAASEGPPADAATDQGAGGTRPARQAGAGARAGDESETQEGLRDPPPTGAPEGARTTRGHDEEPVRHLQVAHPAAPGQPRRLPH